MHWNARRVEGCSEAEPNEGGLPSNCLRCAAGCLAVDGVLGGPGCQERRPSRTGARRAPRGQKAAATAAAGVVLAISCGRGAEQGQLTLESTPHRS